MNQRAIQAIEAIATHAQDNGVKLVGFPDTTFHFGERDKVVICGCTQSVHVQFNNLWAYYAPGRKISYQEGDEEMLVEVSLALQDGSYFAL